MELNKRNMKKIMWLITFTILLLVGIQQLGAVLYTVNWIIGILQPFIIGGCIAFILSVPMKQFEYKVFRKGKSENRVLNKVRRPLSIFLSFLCVIGIIFIVIFLIAPELGNTGATLAETIPGFVEDASVWVDDMLKKYPEVEKYFSDISLDWTQISSNLLTFIKGIADGVFSSAFSIIGSILSTITNVLIGFVFAVYILFNKEKLTQQGKKLLYSFLSIKRADRVVSILQLSNKSFTNFITGQCTEAVIEGLLFFIVLSILRFPYPLLIGVLCAFTALIPVFGALIGSIIGMLLIFMVNPIQALWFIVIFLILQQVESNLIYPHVVGGSIGLPSIWVLFAVTVGGSLMGLVGMLIFIPLFSVVYTLLRENVKIRLLVKRVPEERYLKTDTNLNDIQEMKNERIRQKHEAHQEKLMKQNKEVKEDKVKAKQLEKIEPSESDLLK